MDNTLICYDDVFYNTGRRLGILEPDFPLDKAGIRSRLIEQDRENDFTLLQAEVYGNDIRHALPYPGAMSCLAALGEQNIPTFIVSHKTQFPAAGPRYDLRQAAIGWLDANEVFKTKALFMEDVFFEPTQAAKAKTITRLKCTHFIDDMRLFLDNPLLPGELEKIWFTPPPSSRTAEDPRAGLRRLPSWFEIQKYLLSDWAKQW